MRTASGLSVLCVLVTACGGGDGAPSDAHADATAIDARHVDALGPDDITKFTILGVDGTITGTTILVGLPLDTDVTHLTPTIEISGASVAPTSGSAEDFTTPVTYTVTASDHTTKTYMVTVVRGFAAKVDFTPGDVPVFVAIADLNADAKPDVVVVNRNAFTVSVFLNTTATGARTPTFAPKVDFATGASPLAVAIADVDADGKPDLAVANSTDNTISLLRNTMAPGATTATFAAKLDYGIGNNPTAVGIADIDRDGTMDLVATDYNSNGFAVAVNTSNTEGTTTVPFATSYPFATTTGPISLAIADLNGDGKPDIVVTSLNNDKASVLLNTSVTGGFVPTFAAKVDLSTGFTPAATAIGDLNGDGKLDLAIVNQSNAAMTHGSISVFFNTTATNATTPTFAPVVDIAAGSDSLYIAEADLDADTKPDLVVVNLNPNTVSVYRNITATNATTPTFASTVDFATDEAPQCVAIGDLNRDNKPDLAVVSASINNSTLSIFLAY